jgi:DNA invertase Pin-like site-specific DNA recombinase
MKVALYARVSTDKKESSNNKNGGWDRVQNVENQLLQLREFCGKQGWEIYKEYVDKESGAKGKADRAGFDALFVDAHQKRFELVVFWALDRFGREGARKTFEYLNELDGYGVGQFSFTEPYINTAGPFRDMFIAFKATIDKLERAKLQDRINAGLARAKAQGKVLGRKPVPQIDQKRIIELHLSDPNLSVRAIAQKLSTKDIQYKRGTVHKTLSNFRAGKLQIEGI